MSGELIQEDLSALMVLADDIRTEIVECQKQITAAMTGPPHAEVQTRLDALWTILTQPAENPTVPLLEEVIALLTPRAIPHPGWYQWRWPAAVVLAAALGLGGGWWQWGASAHMRTWATVGSRLDTVLVDQYATLSPWAQQAISALYQQLGLTPPGDRRGKKA